MKMLDRKEDQKLQVQSKVAPATFHPAVCVVTWECSLSDFLSLRFLTKANVKVFDGSSVKGKNEMNQQACSGNQPPPLLPKGRRGVRCEEDTLSLPFVSCKVYFHLMCITFSSVFKRLRLGCMKSSSESSVSSSFSFALGVSSASATSGKSCPGKICCSFSSKNMPTA